MKRCAVVCLPLASSGQEFTDKKKNYVLFRFFFAPPPGGGLVLVTIQGRVPFRQHHMSRRARLGSRARGSYSYHTRSLRLIRRGGNCGWCGRGGCWRCRSGTGGQAGGVPIRGELPSPKIGAAACGSRTSPSWVFVQVVSAMLTS